MTKEELYKSINIVANSMDSDEIQKHREIINHFIENNHLFNSDVEKDLADWNNLVAKRRNEVDKNLDYPNMSAKLSQISSIIDKLNPPV
ncbi:MAG: hypothetical protein DI539_13875 [Flavobacterium psychrophilum]|nr:MAG: hypothetical protein DI539_13875 [Flavobacterium psychrophilum]